MSDDGALARALLQAFQFRDEPWRDWAACKGIVREPADNVFFPNRGQTSEEAKRHCAKCPVTTECADYGDRSGSEYGVWGGELRTRDYIPVLLRPKPLPEALTLPKEYPMIPASFSATAMQAYTECPSRYEAEYFHKAQQPNNEHAGLGTACHGAMEEFVKGGYHTLDDPAEMQRILKTLYQVSYEQVFMGEHKKFEEGWKLLKNWLARQDWTDRTVLSTEEKKSFMLKTSAGEIPFNYIMDRKDRMANGDVEVVDYKTLSMPLQPAELKSKLQARAYAVAAQIEHPDARRIWVTFDMLRFDAVGIVFTIEENRETYRYLQRIAEQIVQDTNPEERINFGCRFCIKKSTCTALQKHAMAGGTLGHTDVEDAAIRAYQAKNAASALNQLAADYEKVVLDHMELNELTELDVGGYEVKVKVSARRAIEEDDLLRVVGAEIMSKYASITIGSVEDMMKVEDLTPEQISRIRQLIKKNYGEPRLAVKPVLEV